MNFSPPPHPDSDQSPMSARTQTPPNITNKTIANPHCLFITTWFYPEKPHQYRTAFRRGLTPLYRRQGVGRRRGEGEEGDRGRSAEGPSITYVLKIECVYFLWPDFVMYGSGAIAQKSIKSGPFVSRRGTRMEAGRGETKPDGLIAEGSEIGYVT